MDVCFLNATVIFKPLFSVWVFLSTVRVACSLRNGSWGQWGEPTEVCQGRVWNSCGGLETSLAGVLLGQGLSFPWNGPSFSVIHCSCAVWQWRQTSWWIQTGRQQRQTALSPPQPGLLCQLTLCYSVCRQSVETEKKERKTNLSFHMGKWSMENTHTKPRLRREKTQLDKRNVISALDEDIHQQRHIFASWLSTRLWGKARGTERQIRKPVGVPWLWSAGNMQTSDCRTNHTTGQLKTGIVAPLIFQL